MKRAILAFLALIAIGCTNQPQAPVLTHALTIQARINRGDNPYRDLNVITDMDSILRVYTGDTIDVIPIRHEQKIALLWYSDGNPGKMVWEAITITADTTIYFYDGE